MLTRFKTYGDVIEPVAKSMHKVAINVFEQYKNMFKVDK